jgi:pimeloyl-ACP methyl ester carboxylesterase
MKKIALYKSGNILSYSDFGCKHGFPILLQHGMIASIDDYDLFETLLDLGTRLISIARPGYGESSPYPMKNVLEWGEIVSVLVDHLQLAQFDILGMSSGAPYSYSIGYALPHKARNIFIFSGIPALYDETVVANWPYPVSKEASITEMKKLAKEVFFSGLSLEDKAKPDIQDSMMNDCYGPALDLRIRGADWGFILSDVHQQVFMEHSRLDDGFITAEMTSKMLLNCKFIARDKEGHFSKELLDDFIKTVMARFYK